MKNNVVNLCFVTDKGYLMPSCVALISALKNKKFSSIYNVYILYKDLDVQEKQIFKDLNYDRVHIELIDLAKYGNFLKYKLKNVHATPTSIYKFFIPEILPKVDKLLFLDGDIIVQDDLAELYDTDLGDNYVAAVKDNNGIDWGINDDRYCYFNSGVMLLNLAKMRKNNTKDAMIKYRKKGLNKLMDQDTFNYVFDKSVLLLPFEYNTQTNALSGIVQKRSGYTLETVQKYWNIQSDDPFADAKIIHYTSIKPWKAYDGVGSPVWYQYYAISPYKNEKLNLESHYIADIVNSTTYRFGKVFVSPWVSLKKASLKIKDRKYYKFLLNFVMAKGDES